MKYLYPLAVILIVILGQPITQGHTQTEPVPSLWHLSSDEHMQHARLVQIDVVEQRIVQEIALPPDWYIASAIWSPNMQYISAVIQQGEGFWEADKQPTKLCLFSNTGELLRCKVLYILVLTGGAYGTKLSPIAWSSDSQNIYVAISHYNGYFDEKRHVSIYTLDTPQLTVNDTVEVDLEWTAIHRWNWAPDVKRIAAYASVDISDMRRRDKLFIINFASNPASIVLSVPEPGGLFEWSYDQQALLYDTYIEP